MNRLSRTLSIIAGLVLGLLAIVLLTAPGFLKRYIEENDKELLGREVFLDDISIGWFSGKLQFTGLEIKESDTSKVFLSVDEILAKISLSALFDKHLFIQSLTIDGLSLEIIQAGKQFNFDDLMATSSDNSAADASDSWRFTMENLTLRQGELNYHSDIAPFIGFDSINVDIPRVADNMDTMQVHVDMLVSSGGWISSLVDISLAESTYSLRFQADEVALQLVEPYFMDFLNLEKVSGHFLANLNLFGSWEDTELLNLSGTLGLRDFEMTDPSSKRLVSVQSLEMAVDTIRMKDAVYSVDHIRALGLYGIYEIYDQGDNFSRLMVANSTNSEGSTGGSEIDYSNPFSILAFYLQDIVHSYQESIYEIKQVAIANSEVNFADYALHEPFRYKLTEIHVFGDSLYSSREKFAIHMGAVLNGTGVFKGDLISYTADPSDMDIHYSINGTGLPPFAPYTHFYIAHPITTGKMLYTCETTIRDGMIDSNNLIEIEDFNFGERTTVGALYDLPVRLAVSLLKDLDGKISLDIPVDGDLNDPNYRLGKVIWNTIKNILLKAVTAPYRLLARSFQVEEEKLKEVHFGLLQVKLTEEQQRQLQDLAKILKAKPELNVEFKRVTDRYDEVERYAIEQSWRNYLLGDTIPESSNDEQQQRLYDVDTSDSLFNAFVDTKIQEADRSLPVQKKCLNYIGEETSVAVVDRIGSRRAEAIASYLSDELQLPNERLKFTIVPSDSLIASRSSAIYNIGFWIKNP